MVVAPFPSVAPMDDINRFIKILPRKDPLMGKKETHKNKTVTIVGYVDPVDEDDSEAGVVISTDNDEEYLVDPNKQGRRLLNLLGEKIRAQGTVAQTEDGENQISITAFEVLEYQETSEDDDYSEPDTYFDRYED